MGARKRRLAIILAAIVALVIIATVMLLVALPLRILEYNARHPAVRAERWRITEAYDYLETGDLLLFVAGTHMPTNSGLAGTYYSHAAVVVRREGPDPLPPLLTAESQSGTPLMQGVQMRPGAITTPLLARLRSYAGTAYVALRRRPLEPGATSALAAEAARRYPYPTAAQSVAALLWGRRPAARHCFEQVAHLLAVAGAPLSPTAPTFLGACRLVCEAPGGPDYFPARQLIYDIE